MVGPNDLEPTDYSDFLDPFANGYEYTQLVELLDDQPPIALDCPEASFALVDGTPNDPKLWNKPVWFDPITMSHDLSEAPVDLALADVQKLKKENSALREELDSRPAASNEPSPELIALRSECETLTARVKELEKAVDPAAATADSSQEMDDLRRRFEMAVDDVRQLKQENARLEDMDLREKFALIPLVAMAVVMGIAPMLILRTTEKSVNLVKEAVVGKPSKVAVVPVPADDHSGAGQGK